MNIFNYLMNKKGHEIFNNDDILSYLLKKGRVHKASGTEISIENVKGFESLTLSKLSTQNTTTGKNLFNINGDVNTRYDGQSSTNNTVSGNDLTTITNGGSTHLYGQKIYVGTGNTVSLSVKLKSITYTTEPSENSTVAYMSLYNDNTTTGQLSSGLKYNEVGIRKTITFIAQTDYIYAAFGRASLSNSATFTDIQVEIGSATSYEPYTGGIPSPNPSYPQEVNTVKGYRNLFDVATWVQKGNNSNYYSYTNNTLSINTLDTRSLQDFTETEKIYLPNGTYYLSNIENAGIRIYNTNENSPVLTNEFTVTLGYIYLKLVSSSVITCNPMITKGTTELPYVPYGTNYIYTTITDGTNTKYVTIPLNNNEVCGIQDIKDEIVIDKYGHAKLVKKIGKVVLDENNIGFYKGSNYSQIYSIVLDVDKFGDQTTAYSNRFIYAYNNNYGGFYINTTKRINFLIDSTITTLAQAQAWLSTHDVYAYYILATEQEIDLGTVEMELYEGNNNITNSENMDMVLEYYK